MENEQNKATPTCMEYMERAEDSLARAKAAARESGELCPECQRAVEMAYKSALAHAGIPIPDTHSIEALLSALDGLETDIPAGLLDTVTLTDCLGPCYDQGSPETATHDQYLDALGLAESAVAWSKGQLGHENHEMR